MGDCYADKCRCGTPDSEKRSTDRAKQSGQRSKGRRDFVDRCKNVSCPCYELAPDDQNRPDSRRRHSDLGNEIFRSGIESIKGFDQSLHFIDAHLDVWSKGLADVVCKDIKV